MGWVKYSTVGAKAGDNIKDESGNVLDNEDIRNDDLTLAYSGTNIQIKKAGSQIGSNVDSPTALKNASVTINANGTLSGAGSGTPSLASIGGIVGTAGGGFGASMAAATGAISFSSGTLAAGTLPAGVGGTGLTATTTLQNATIAIDGTTGVISGIGTADIKVNNSKVTQQADGTLNYAGATAAQVNIGSIAASNFDTAGDLTGDLSLKSALTIPASSGNKIICGNITIDGEFGRILITD